MRLTMLALPGLCLLEPEKHFDERGCFFESWSKRALEAAGLFYDFVQDNESFTARRDTLRGIHFQRGDCAQAKLVRCARGAVLDVAVDLRPESPAFRRHAAMVLSADNGRQLLLPRGFGHAFLTLTDETLFLYKVDRPYTPAAEGCVRWDDPELGIDWCVKAPLLSPRDAAAPMLSDIL